MDASSQPARPRPPDAVVLVFGLVVAFSMAACGGTADAPAVSSVQLQCTYTNPYVGEVVHVGATPVNAGGVAVPGVACTFASGSPAIASVVAATGEVTAHAPGTATITATCGGKDASLDITVRPLSVALTITKLGSGSGAVFASPAGIPLNTYAPGTSVTLTATAVAGSTFIGWGAPCAGTDPCTLVMNANVTVTATFTLKAILAINKLGTGGGVVLATPAGSPPNTYDPGTNVTLTATANAGSTFIGWGGACAGKAPCILIMNSDTTVTATFSQVETFVSNSYAASLGSVTGDLGCRYAVSASGILTLEVVENADGTVSGNASSTPRIGIVTTYSPPFTTCTSLPFDVSATGAITGSDANLAAALASANGAFTMAFTGARSGTTITGSAVITQTLHDGAGTAYVLSGPTAPFTATKR